MTLILDKDMGEEVATRLLQQKRMGGYPFNKAKNPHIPENMPKSLCFGDLERSNFLFISCYWMRGGIESDTAIRSLSRLYDDRPELFVPSVAKNVEPEKIRVLLVAYGLGWGATDNARFWVENAKVLDEKWGGDPRRIFHDVLDVSPEEAWKRLHQRIARKGINGFLGFQAKMVSMIIYFLIDSCIVPAFVFPNPIDFHWLRLCFANGILLDLSDNGKINILKASDMLREFTFGYCERWDINPTELCDAFWLFGRNMCSVSPYNSTSVGERDGRNTALTPKKITWSIAQLNAYDKTCDVCVLKTTCKFFVRAATYYVQGAVKVEAKPQGPLKIFQTNDFHQLTPKRVVPRKPLEEDPCLVPLFDWQEVSRAANAKTRKDKRLRIKEEAK